jgi:hypothetical protein
VAALAGLVGGRWTPRPAAYGILFFTYLTPLAFRAILGRFSIEFLLVWSAAITGFTIGERNRWTWAYPGLWRFPLVAWALVVALGWPIMSLREIDFESLALLRRYGVVNTAVGGSPEELIRWGMDTAVVQLVGLLWFNWLLQNAGRVSDASYERWIAKPLAASAVAASLLAVYQGLYDNTFLAAPPWPLLHRASGSLMDANASGTVAAMWTAGLLSFHSRTWGGRATTLSGVAACWGGLWMTGSRTALALAGTALVVIGFGLLRHLAGARLRLGIPAAAVAMVALLGAILLMDPGTSQTPLARFRRTLPSDMSGATLGAFAQEMWNRNGYGRAATALIAEHPIVGIGIGVFHAAGAAYLRVPPDNAQNWWRHQVVELGVLGAAGLLYWTGVFLVFLARTSGTDVRRLPAAALKGALLAFGAISLVGMPAQSLPVTITFWTLAFWYMRVVQWPLPYDADSSPSRTGWTCVAAVVGAYAITLAVLARGDDRPPMRAVAGQWAYTYGVYDPPGLPQAEGATLRWTEQHGVTVLPHDVPWLILTIRAEHPDIRDQPVRARVDVNGRTIVDTKLHTHAPLTRVIDTGTSPRAVIETRVSRTWRPLGASANHPEVGLSLSWRFVAHRLTGMPAVSAPLRP